MMQTTTLKELEIATLGQANAISIYLFFFFHPAGTRTSCFRQRYTKPSAINSDGATPRMKFTLKFC